MYELFSSMHQNKIFASIITIGDELLIGQTIDTNSAWMAQQLNKAGIRVVRRVAVGDVAEEIRQALDEEQQHADIILITGGLGPTADDITKPLLCKYFDGKMVVNEEARQNVLNIFTQLLDANGEDIITHGEFDSVINQSAYYTLEQFAIQADNAGDAASV